MISNLLDNATKNTPVDGRLSLSQVVSEQWLVTRARASRLPSARAALMSSASREALPRVFEPFVQDRHAAHHERGGLGLGLVVVRELIAAHGGSVCARSAGLGAGSRFVVKLPAGPVA